MHIIMYLSVAAVSFEVLLVSVELLLLSVRGEVGDFGMRIIMGLWYARYYVFVS